MFVDLHQTKIKTDIDYTFLGHLLTCSNFKPSMDK